MGCAEGQSPFAGQEKRPTPDCFAPFAPLRNNSPVARNDGLIIARPDKVGAWQSCQVWRLTGRSRILPPAPDRVRRLSPLTAAGGLIEHGVCRGAKPLPGQEKRPTPDCFAPFDPLSNNSPVAHNDGLIIARPDKVGAWQSCQVWRLTGRSRILPPAPDRVRRLSPLTAAGGLIEHGVCRGAKPLPGQEKRPTPDCFAPFEPLRNTSPVARNDGLVIARPDKVGAWQSCQVWRLTGRSRIPPGLHPTAPPFNCRRRVDRTWGVQRGKAPLPGV